jgi:glycosyl transferase family 25
MKVRDYFERILVINLAERTDRRAEMEWELERAGLSPEPGHIEFFQAVKVNEASGFDNPGYHGCFRSHLEILKLAAAAGLSNVLVFEDDAALSDRFKFDEESLIDHLKTNEWGIVFFGHGLEDIDDRPTRLQLSPNGAPLMHFYAVNGKCFGRLIEFLEKMLARPAGHPDGGPMSPDGAFHVFLVQNPDVVCYVTSPSLATQRSSRSDLMPKWFDKVPGLRQTASTVRKVKRWLKAK